MPDFSDALDFLLALIAIWALIAVFIDRCRREKAWRAIAEERRWNHDVRTDGPPQNAGGFQPPA